MLDDKLGITLSPGKIEHCKTVGDLLALAGDRVNAEETVQ
jgi:acyl carrier protein